MVIEYLSVNYTFGVTLLDSCQVRFVCFHLTDFAGTT
jgi:hypothetical protein